MKLKATGNTQLVEYGIQNEKSDLRAHVCVVAGRVYTYATEDGQAAIATGAFRTRDVKTHNIVTARGYLVPPGRIKGCRWVDIPQVWRTHPALKIEHSDSTGVKGERAAQIVRGLLIQNKFPLFAGTADMVSDEVLQVQGIDISVTVRIQVKCDFRGGHRDAGGTGNLFLQTHECNPFKQY
jgi:hypothetical protein